MDDVPNKPRRAVLTRGVTGSLAYVASASALAQSCIADLSAAPNTNSCVSSEPITYVASASTLAQSCIADLSAGPNNDSCIPTEPVPAMPKIGLAALIAMLLVLLVLVGGVRKKTQSHD